MTKSELIELLNNSRAVPDDAEVVIYESGGKFTVPEAESILFVVDQFGAGCPGGLG